MRDQGFEKKSQLTSISILVRVNKLIFYLLSQFLNCVTTETYGGEDLCLKS